MTAPSTLVTAGPPASVATRPPLRRLRLVLPVAAVALAAVAIGGAGREMWYDEYVTWYATTLSWSKFWQMLGHVDLVHALYYVVMRLWTGAFGDSVLALRLPSFLAMAVAAGALTALGRRLYGVAVGVSAGLIFAALPAVSRYGQEARSYAWVTALAVLATLALLRALERPSWRRFLLYGVTLLALTYLHFVAATVLAAHAALVWRAARRGGGRPVARAWLAAMLGLVLAVAPLLYGASTQSAQVAWVSRDRRAVSLYPVELFGSPTVAWVLIPTALLGAAVLWYARRGPILPLLLWAVLPPVVSYAVHPVAHLFLARYALFTLPAWALLAGAAIAVPVSGLRRWLKPADRVVVLGLALLLVAAAGLGGQARVRQSPVAGEVDFRAAARVIDGGYQPGDGIAYAGFDQTRQTRLPLAYELRTRPRDVFQAVPADRSKTFTAVECADPVPCLGDTPRLWLVVAGGRLDPVDAFPPVRAQLLRREFTVAEVERLPRVDVALLVRR